MIIPKPGRWRLNLGREPKIALLLLPIFNEAYIIPIDPFFTKLAAWGDTIWQLWKHNMDLPGAASILMAENFFKVPGDNPVKAPLSPLIRRRP